MSEDQIRGVYRDTIDALYGAVSRKCDGDRDLAEDVVQETWLRAVRDWKVNGLPQCARFQTSHRKCEDVPGELTEYVEDRSAISKGFLGYWAHRRRNVH